MMESLEEFGKLSEFEEMDNIVSGMMAKAAENQQETSQIKQLRQRRIQKELEEVSKKYGRVMTPYGQQRVKASQLEAVNEESNWLIITTN